jgi:uncharacterized protein involved in exopolysaccharide biosynthesis
MLESSKTSAVHANRGTALENGDTVGAPEEKDVIELLLVLTREKKRIVQITVAAALLAAVVCFIIPRTYTATASILPPQQSQSTASSLLGQIGLITGLANADLGLRNPADLFVAMLKSRTIEDNLINRFDLRKVYWVKRYQDARRKLEDRSAIETQKEGLISISVTDRDPRRAADLANAYVEELYSLNQNLAVTEASQRRLFYQRKLDEEREALSQSELALKLAQEKTGLIQPDAQGRAIIEAIADMRAQVATHEVRLQAMRTYATANNPDVKRAEQELAGLRGQLAKLERNTGETGNGNVAVPTRQLPQAQLAYIRAARDLKYHESVYEFLGKQLEAARLDEAQNALLVQVVDRAVAPERKSGPKRMLITLVSALTAFVLACLGVLLLEALRRQQQDPNQRARLALLRHSLRFSSWN